MAKEEATLTVRIKQTGQRALTSIRDGIAGVGKAAAVAGTALAGFVGLSVRNFARQEAAVNKLNTALISNGEFTNEASQALQQWAAELQNTSNIGDEVILENFALARSYTASAEQAKALTAAAADFAKGANISFTEALRRLGRSVQGATGDVANFAPEIRDLTREQLAAGASIDIIANKFRGFAEQETLTTAGSITRLRNNFGDLTEAIGQRAAPVITKIADAISDLSVDLQKNRGFISGLVTSFKFATKTLVLFKAVLVGIGQFIGTIFASRVAALTQLVSLNFKKALEEIARGNQLIVEDAMATIRQFQEDQAAVDELFDEARKDRTLTNQQNLTAGIVAGEKSKGKQLKTLREIERQNELKRQKQEAAEQEKKRKLEEAANREKIAAAQSTFSTISTLTQSNNKELVALGKAAAIANITISTAQGVMNAFKLGPILGAILAPIVIAASTVQSAKVAGVQLQEGGIVRSTPGGISATIGEGGDDELVLPLNDEILSRVGGSNITVNVMGGLLGDETSARELAVAIDSELLKLRQNNESLAFDTDVI